MGHHAYDGAKVARAAVDGAAWRRRGDASPPRPTSRPPRNCHVPRCPFAAVVTYPFNYGLSVRAMKSIRHHKYGMSNLAVPEVSISKSWVLNFLLRLRTGTGKNGREAQPFLETQAVRDRSGTYGGRKRSPSSQRPPSPDPRGLFKARFSPGA